MTGDPAGRPIPVVFNPTAGGGRAKRLRAELEEAAIARDVVLDWRATTAPGHASSLAAGAAEQGHRLILAFGGDGTYNEVAEGLLGTETAMGVVPAGTTSVLAYEFGVPRPVALSLGPLIDGEDRLMHVGYTDRGDIILIMLSAGPDAMVLENLMPWLKPLGGRVGVAFQAVLELMRPAGFPVMKAVVNEQEFESGWVVVGKSRSYAGPFEACPEADPFEPRFHVVLSRERSRRAALGFVGDLARGRLLSRTGVEGHVLDSVRLEARGEAERVAYQVDGDFKGHLPVTIRVHPKRLRVRLPRV